MNDLDRPNAGKSRELLDLVIEARKEYSEYLRAVAAGERGADPVERSQLKERCESTLKTWRETHRAWQGENWLRNGRNLQHGSR